MTGHFYCHQTNTIYQLFNSKVEIINNKKIFFLYDINRTMNDINWHIKEIPDCNKTAGN